MERDMRDPGTLGNALLTLRGDKKKLLSQVADDIDRGVLGILLIHPAFLNGRSSERMEVIRSL